MPEQKLTNVSALTHWAENGSSSNTRTTWIGPFSTCDELQWVLIESGNLSTAVPVEFEMFYCLPEVAPVFAYVVPVMALIGLVTNLMASVILLREEMRTPTNLILLAIGTANTLTACCPIPAYVYFYTMGNYMKLIPSNWCTPYRVFLDYLPAVFHTVAIWLTTCLALQRYVYVCQPDHVKRWCSNKTSVVTALVVVVASAFTHFPRLFEFSCEETVIELNGTTFYASTRVLSQWLIVDSRENITYFIIQNWTRCMIINIIPCTLLIVLTAVLLRKVRLIAKRRRQIVKRRQIQTLEDSNRLTIMLVIVVTIFLIVEIPSGIFTILSNLKAVHTKRAHLVTQLIVNVFVLVSYPINFFVYCGMSRQFRTIFVEIFLPCIRTREMPKSRTSDNLVTVQDNQKHFSIMLNDRDVHSNGLL